MTPSDTTARGSSDPTRPHRGGDSSHSDYDPSSSSFPPRPPSVVSVVVSRSASSSGGGGGGRGGGGAGVGSVRLAVAARLHRRRDDHRDRVEFTLEHYSFLDDRNRFTNLDALLTRLAPVGCVYVACSESAELNAKSAGNKNQIRRAREVSDLLTRIADVVDSRTDIVAAPSPAADGSAGPAPSAGLSHVVKTLPKPLRTPASAVEHVDRAASHLLGGDGSDRHLSYRGDRTLMDDPLPKRAIGLLLHGEGAVLDGDRDESARGAYEIRPGSLDSYLTLDRTAAECINLLPPRGGSGAAVCLVGGAPSNNSVLGVLDRCKTRMGPRLLEVWLRQPLVDVAEIRRRQGAVAAMVDDSVGRDRLREEGLAPLAGSDLDALCCKLTAASRGESGAGGTGSALELLYRMYMFADRHLPCLADALSDLVRRNGEGGESGGGGGDGSDGSGGDGNGGALASALDGLTRTADDLSMARGLVEAVLDFDSAPQEFLVKSDFDSQLADVKSDLDDLETELERAHSEMGEGWSNASGQNASQVRLEMSERGGAGGSTYNWEFRLPGTNDMKLLQEKFGDAVTVHRVLKNGVYFTTRELRQLATKKHDLLMEYQEKQRAVVTNALGVAVTYVPVLERASGIVAELDALASMAHVAAVSPHGYCRPVLTDGEEDGMGIRLRQARHPCVELQEGVEFIPNDVELVYGSSSFLLVTGPNMGGKSTYIRSLGAIVAMAQIGSYVPCSSATINVVHHILARVGAGDVQDRGISTFMAEMLEASSILRTATKRSLIIVDELGRGTSTFDGLGLATAISEYVVQRIGCPTVFATHFHELTALEERERSVRNCHVTARRAEDGTNGLTFLYEVRPGPCLESFGIQVADMAGVPGTVVEDAKRKARQLENFDYRKKRRGGGGGDDGDDDDNDDGTGGGGACVGAEEAAAAVDFVNDLRRLPLDTFRGREEKRRALLDLWRRHSS